MARRNSTTVSTSNDNSTFNLDHGDSIGIRNSNKSIDKSCIDGKVYLYQDNVVEELTGNIDPRGYCMDTIIDIQDLEITIPSTGILIHGMMGSTSGLITSSDNHTMFKSQSEQIGSGDITLQNLTISSSGSNSKVFNVYDNESEHKIKLTHVKLENITEIGDAHEYCDIIEDCVKKDEHYYIKWYVTP